MRLCPTVCVYVSSIIVVFLLAGLSQPIAEHVVWLVCAIWGLYGAYVRFWIENGGAVLIVQISLCSVVGGFYVALSYVERRNQYHDQLADGVSDSLTVPLDLRKFTHLFQKYIEMNLLLPHCFEKHLLNWDDIEKIKAADKRLQVVRLISMVEKKGRLGQAELISCLKAEKEHLGHAEIAETLIKDLQEMGRMRRRQSIAKEDEVVKLKKELAICKDTIETLEAEKKVLERQIKQLMGVT